MNQKLLNLFFLIAITFSSFAQVANGPLVAEVCDDEISDGVYAFDLSVFDTEILGSQDPIEFSVSYFQTLVDADTNSNPLPIFYTNTTNPETIFTRITENSSSNFDTTQVTLSVNPSPLLTAPTDLVVCDLDNDGFATFDLFSKAVEISGGQIDIIITYYESASDADLGINPLSNTYNNITNPQTIFVRGEDDLSGCYANTTLTIEAIACDDSENVIVDQAIYTIEELVENVLIGGDCSQIFNITYATGATYDSEEPNGIGYFFSGSSGFPFADGILLSTGSASDGSGPNESVNDNGSGTNAWPGDVDLELATGIQSFNATVIEFDFVPVVNQISFDFLMASDEYDGGSFECSFSDAFAFLLTDALGNTTNLAVLPETNEPISVTNIHPFNGSCPAVNEEYFGGYIPLNTPPIAYNGRTTTFTAQSQVNIGESYHIKLVIADAADSLFDSAVFLKGGSFDIGELCNDIGLINVKAFNDANLDGNLDADELDFTNGYFTYEKNNDGVINTVNTSIGNFSIVSTDENDTYSISFNIYDEYSVCYSTTTTIVDAISVLNGDVTIVDFPVTDDLVCEDLAVYLVNPFESPRPGFDYDNNIVLENLSSFDISSGTIAFTHDDLLEFNGVLNLNPNYTLTVTANGFTIDFVNLEAGESEAIEVLLSCPVTVDLDEVVTNTVTYLTDANDLFADNNTSELSEIVIGSYDPNDKIEAHGPEIIYDDFITTDEYLYYTIRFQNLGTADAIFIRIEDELDAMLDEATFQMLSSSHDYVVTRTEKDLEWYFENINLPAEQDDAEGSNGYVYFKIKPKLGYSVGDVISNTASIYFDFNAPILTNMFITTFVEPLSVASYNNNVFAMYPNPSSGEFTIELNTDFEENLKLEIYDVQGKLVYVSDSFNSRTIDVDVTELNSGLYFVHVKNREASAIQKLIIN